MTVNMALKCMGACKQSFITHQSESLACNHDIYLLYSRIFHRIKPSWPYCRLVFTWYPFRTPHFYSVIPRGVLFELWDWVILKVTMLAGTLNPTNHTGIKTFICWSLLAIAGAKKLFKKKQTNKLINKHVYKQTPKPSSRQASKQSSTNLMGLAIESY